MRAIYLNEYEADMGTVVALGNFDGVHNGHRSLMEETVRVGKESGLRTAVYTFDEHPANILAKSYVLPVIMTTKERIEAFWEHGIADVILDKFTKDKATMAPLDFFEEILVKKLNAKHVVCGFHYHFGSKGEGDARLLAKLCKQAGLGLSVMPACKKSERVISSTWVRECISMGDMIKAAELMGREYTLTGIVEHGAKLGRTIGVPTINQFFPEGKVKPLKGVYYTHVYIDGIEYKGATNVGMRPTVEGSFLNCETFILGFDGDLYGREVKLSFVRIIREEQKFETLQMLKHQLNQDIELIASL